MTGRRPGIEPVPVSAAEPESRQVQSDPHVTMAVLEQASGLLDHEVNRCASQGYQALLVQANRLREREVKSIAGERFSVCTQVFRPNGLECTLELRASVQWLRGDEVVPLSLRAAIAITPDDEVSRL